MKKYIIFIASAVLMMAACAKEEINTAITGRLNLSLLSLMLQLRQHFLQMARTLLGQQMMR